MFDVLFTPAVFPGTESKTDIITESRVINHNENENISRTRRIKKNGKNTSILPPFGYANVWQGSN